MEQKRFVRSRKDVKIAGVCGGIAEHFQVDPTLVRLLFVLAVLFEGIGLIAYVVLWVIVPQAPLPAPPTSSDPEVTPEGPPSEEGTSEQQAS